MDIVVIFFNLLGVLGFGFSLYVYSKQKADSKNHNADMVITMGNTNRIIELLATYNLEEAKNKSIEAITPEKQTEIVVATAQNVISSYAVPEKIKNKLIDQFIFNQAEYAATWIGARAQIATLAAIAVNDVSQTVKKTRSAFTEALTSITPGQIEEMKRAIQNASKPPKKPE